jgi:DNA-binding FadR family transcriptional regulator
VAKIQVEHLTEKFSDMLKLSKITIDQLTEARLEIALINLKYFIERGNKKDIQELETCVREIERLLKSDLQAREQNLLFHQLIAKGSKNPVFILLHNALLDILRHFLSKFSSPSQHSKKILGGKKKILKYIKEKNLEKASSAMKTHIRYTGKRTKLLIQNTEQVDSKN